MNKYHVYLFSIFVTSLFVPDQAYSSCESPSTAIEVVNCIRSNSPDIKQIINEQSQTEKLRGIATRRPNPKLETQSTIGRNRNNGPDVSGSNDKLYNIEMALIWPIELGNKVEARLKEAEAKIKQVQSDILKVEAEVILQTILGIQRLRQINKEMKLFEESIATYNNLVRQYRLRTHLSSEQKVSKLVFELAKEDIELKITSLLKEQKSLDEFFLKAGVQSAHLKKVLAKSIYPDKLPPISNEKINNQHSPNIQRLNADKELSIAELKVARSISWPDIEIGPVLSYQSEGDSKSQSIGFQLSIPLPFSDYNKAGHEYASSGLGKAESNLNIQLKNEEIERKQLIQTYKDLIQLLSKVPNDKALASRSIEIKRLAVQGLVSSSLIIETHRQEIEFIQDRNQLEIQALEAWLKLQMLNGNITKESTLREVL
ncbi:MAG: TolC family protein [Oligoflexia bacterium]|nr:TolC family protein [Oligoflexia bacterium]